MFLEMEELFSCSSMSIITKSILRNSKKMLRWQAPAPSRPCETLFSPHRAAFLSFTFRLHLRLCPPTGLLSSLQSSIYGLHKCLAGLCSKSNQQTAETTANGTVTLFIINVTPRPDGKITGDTECIQRLCYRPCYYMEKTFGDTDCLHAKTIDMFISHLTVTQDGSELPLEKLTLMNQALHGIFTLLDAGHTPPSAVNNCSCQITLASNWKHILDCAEFVLNADDYSLSAAHVHLEKRISAVFRSATHRKILVQLIYEAFGRKTTSIVCRLLLRQDIRVGRSWGNEETIAYLHGYSGDMTILFDIVEDTGDDPTLIADILAKRLRFLSKEVITIETMDRMEPIMHLIKQIIYLYSFDCPAFDSVKTVADIAKSLSQIAAALTSPAGRGDRHFRYLALQTIIHGLWLYETLSGYSNLPLATTFVRLGLFGVVLAINPFLMKTRGFEEEVDAVKGLFGNVLPEFLLFGSFVEVVVDALRPLVKDERLSMLSRGVFGGAWLRFERALLERYTANQIRYVDANHKLFYGLCHNVSTPHPIPKLSSD